MQRVGKLSVLGNFVEELEELEVDFVPIAGHVKERVTESGGETQGQRLAHEGLLTQHWLRTG